MQHEATNGRDPICNMRLPMVGTICLYAICNMKLPPMIYMQHEDGRDICNMKLPMVETLYAT